MDKSSFDEFVLRSSSMKPYLITIDDILYGNYIDDLTEIRENCNLAFNFKYPQYDSEIFNRNYSMLSAINAWTNLENEINWNNQLKTDLVYWEEKTRKKGRKFLEKVLAFYLPEQ